MRIGDGVRALRVLSDDVIDCRLHEWWLVDLAAIIEWDIGETTLAAWLAEYPVMIEISLGTSLGM